MKKTLYVMAMIMISSLMIQAYGLHYYVNHKWSGTKVDLCYDMFGLGYLNIDGNSNQATIAESQIDIARNDWNSKPSKFTLNKISTPCANWIYGGGMGVSGPTAQTVLCVGSTCVTDWAQLPAGYITKASITFNTTDSWKTTEVCTSPRAPTGPWTLNYVARHEFGHLVVFGHYFGTSPSSTVMYYEYNCASRNSVKSHDSASLTSIYG